MTAEIRSQTNGSSYSWLTGLFAMAMGIMD